MPEIKLGSSKNAKNINLGSKEIEEVRLGRVLVWQNNIAPQIVLTTPEVGEYGDLDFPIGITVASNVNIVFSAQDLDPLDTIVSYAVDGPTDFPPIPTTPITPPGNPVTGLTFTIPNNLFTNPGEPTTNNVFTVTVTDQRGKEGIYTVTVVNVSVPPPTITVTKEFGSKTALTSQGAQSSTARWSITQPTETGLAGYTMQYSFDNVNWSNGSTTAFTATTSCGGSQTVRVYCRSVKAGSTTAIGNSAASTFSVSAPSKSLNVSVSNCVYDYIDIRNFTINQRCDGSTVSAGYQGNGVIRLGAGSSGYNQSSYAFTGTSYSTLSGAQGDTITVSHTQRSYIQYSVRFTKPSDPNTTLSYTCSGGDYRSTPIGGPAILPLPGLNPRFGNRGAVGTTQTTSLINKGPDYKYTNLRSNTNIASISSFSTNYGGTSATISFNQVGGSGIVKPTYSGGFRLAMGGTYDINGSGEYHSYTTLSNNPAAGTVISDTCSGTTQILVIADGNGGSTTTTIPNSTECGYVAPPGRKAFFRTEGANNAGGVLIAWSFGSDGTKGSTVMGPNAEYNNVCVDPNETKWNNGWYNVDYSPNQNGITTFQATLSSTPCFI